ncbi:MAG: hypothetical protein WC943_08650 [Elusimicrobiota bacterium]|jgi:hypothetical protein
MLSSGSWRPYLALAACVGLGFGFHAPLLGFYHDDWAFLELASNAGGLLPAMSAFASAGYLSRPVEILQFPLFFSLGGFDPGVYHGLILTLHFLGACLFFILLKDLLGSPRIALAAASLAALHPSPAILRVWFASSPQTLAIVMCLASLVVFQRHLAARRKRTLFSSQGLYLASILCYESTAFLPLVLAGGLAGRAWAQGRRPTEALPRSLAPLWPYGLSLALALVYQSFAVAALSQANPKTTAFAASHILKVFGAGFECLTNRVLHLCWKSAPSFWAESSVASLGLWVAVGVGAGLALRFGEDSRSPAFRAGLGAAVFGFIGAYLPYALSSSYVPQVFGFMSRTNGVGALAGGLGLALFASLFARRPVLQKTFLGLAFLAFFMADWHNGRQFAKLWKDQQELLSAMSRASTALPRGSAVLLDPAPREGPALFAGHYDLSAALRFTTARKDLYADLVGSASAPSGKGVFVYSEKTGLLEPLRAGKAPTRLLGKP